MAVPFHADVAVNKSCINSVSVSNLPFLHGKTCDEVELWPPSSAWKCHTDPVLTCNLAHSELSLAHG